MRFKLLHSSAATHLEAELNAWTAASNIGYDCLLEFHMSSHGHSLVAVLVYRDV